MIVVTRCKTCSRRLKSMDYCTDYGMIINEQKTRFMVFNGIFDTKELEAHRIWTTCSFWWTWSILDVGMHFRMYLTFFKHD